LRQERGRFIAECSEGFFSIRGPLGRSLFEAYKAAVLAQAGLLSQISGQPRVAARMRVFLQFTAVSSPTIQQFNDSTIQQT